MEGFVKILEFFLRISLTRGAAFQAALKGNDDRLRKYELVKLRDIFIYLFMRDIHAEHRQLLEDSKRNVNKKHLRRRT